MAMGMTQVRTSGVVKFVTGADVGAGLELSDTVPAGKLWLLRAIYLPFVTDVTVATRVPTIKIDGGADGKLVFNDPASTGSTASQTKTYLWIPGTDAAATETLLTHGTIQYKIQKRLFPLVSDRILVAGSRVTTVTSGIVAGDNYGPVQYLVEEFNVDSNGVIIP